MQKNPHASIPEDMDVTSQAVHFVESISFEEIPQEALRIGTRCILDGVGLFVAGTDESSVKILAAGKIDVFVDRCLRLNEASQAHQRLENRKALGKIVLVPEAFYQGE